MKTNERKIPFIFFRSFAFISDELAIWLQRRWPALDIRELIAWPQASQQVIADRAAAGREVVEVVGSAEELDRVAHANGALGQVGDVDDGQVHRHASD